MGAFEYRHGKAAADRARDRESLPRLRSFRDYWVRKNRA